MLRAPRLADRFGLRGHDLTADVRRVVRMHQDDNGGIFHIFSASGAGAGAGGEGGSIERGWRVFDRPAEVVAPVGGSIATLALSPGLAACARPGCDRTSALRLPDLGDCVDAAGDACALGFPPPYSRARKIRPRA